MAIITQGTDKGSFRINLADLGLPSKKWNAYLRAAARKATVKNPNISSDGRFSATFRDVGNFKSGQEKQLAAKMTTIEVWLINLTKTLMNKQELEALADSGR